MYKYITIFLSFTSFFGQAEINIKVLDIDGKALSGIVVELNAKPNILGQSGVEKSVEMQQVDQQFVPHVLAIAQGTKVNFPDSDSVKHHVYSFSEAKSFEIAIYKQNIKRSIVFDKAGVVELGCNIHDWMLGYIYVSRSPVFTKTNNAGIATFKGSNELGNSNLSEHAISASIWHPRLDSKDIEKSFTLTPNNTVNTIQLEYRLAPSYAEFDDVHGLSDYD